MTRGPFWNPKSILMERMRSLSLPLALAFAAAFYGQTEVSAQQAIEDYDIETVPLADGLHMLVGPGGNIGLSVGPDGVFMVDALYSVLYDKIMAAIREVSDAEVRYLLNTHFHYDHADGNVAFGEAGAVIVGHENTALNFVGDQELAFIPTVSDPLPEAGRPTLTFTDSVTFHFNGDEIVAFHPGPAHTDGDVIVHFRHADVLHMGDIVFSAGYPYIDIYHGGSIGRMIAVVDDVMEWIDENTRIIPGHGPVTDREGLRAYRDMLATVRDRVQEAVEDGMTADEAVAAGLTTDLDERWTQGMGSEVFIRLVHQDLSGG